MDISEDLQAIRESFEAENRSLRESLRLEKRARLQSDRSARYCFILAGFVIALSCSIGIYLWEQHQSDQFTVQHAAAELSVANRYRDSAIDSNSAFRENNEYLMRSASVANCKSHVMQNKEFYKAKYDLSKKLNDCESVYGPEKPFKNLKGEPHGKTSIKES